MEAKLARESSRQEAVDDLEGSGIRELGWCGAPPLDDPDLVFSPHPFLSHPIAQTVAAAMWKSERESAAPVAHAVELRDGDSVVVFEDAPSPEHDRNSNVVLLHALGSSSHDPQIRHLSAILTRAGYRCFRADHRGIGASKRAREVYHPGRSEDIVDIAGAVCDLRPGEHVMLVAFSISSNMLLRHLGRASLGLEYPLPPRVAGAVVVSPVIDLHTAAIRLDSVAAGALGRFIAGSVRRQLVKRHTLRPELGELGLSRNPRVRDIIEYLVRYSQFRDLDDCCEKTTAQPWISSIRFPLYVVSSADDPLVPVEHRPWLDHSSIHCVQTRHGGHLGFISASPGSSGYRRWLDHALLSMMRKLDERQPNAALARPSHYPEP